MVSPWMTSHSRRKERRPYRSLNPARSCSSALVWQPSEFHAVAQSRLRLHNIAASAGFLWGLSSQRHCRIVAEQGQQLPSSEGAPQARNGRSAMGRASRKMWRKPRTIYSIAQGFRLSEPWRSVASSSAGDLYVQHGISSPDDPSDGGINSVVGHGEKATRIVDTAGGFFLTICANPTWRS